VSVIPTGVDLTRFSPGSREPARRRLGLPADGLICLYTGRLDREKSLERVLDAFESVAAAVSNASLHLVGKGSHGHALERRAATGRVGRRIVFHGGLGREVLPDYYRAADLFLFASETETQGLVLAEAHACALPAVAVRASGVDEVVSDGETGVLTKGESGEMADAAIGLLLDPARRVAMGQAARRLAEARFPAGRQIEAMVGHYEALLARPR
jgi:glycosyltransferase involved in cell wall biosynthesis